MSGEAAFQWNSRGTRKPSIPDSGSHRVLPIRIAPKLTAALVQCTRKRRVTMNAILTAALMIGVKRVLYGGRDRPMRNLTFADLRPYLSKTIPDSALGCYMGLCRFDVLLQDNPDFWKLADTIQSIIYRSNHRGERFLANAMSPGMMKMIIGMKKMRMGTTALSYAGPIPSWEGRGGLRLTGLHAFTSNITMGPEFSALVRLFQGELWWDMFYFDEEIAPERSRQIVGEVESALESAAARA
jgi:hypothetical protein